MSEDKVRLQKFLSHQGVCSRRKAEELIASACVFVNDIPAIIGATINPQKDIVKINGVQLKNERPFQREPSVLMMNKPKGYVCSHNDKFNEKTIFDLLPPKFARQKWLFCGRLDKDTTGLIILADDGSFVQRLSHPSANIQKHYELILSRPLEASIRTRLLRGVVDKGEFIKLDKLISIGKGRLKNKIFEAVLSQGRKNEIHRIFEHFGYFVEKLQRTKIGKLILKGVAPGHCRQLSSDEVSLLFK